MLAIGINHEAQACNEPTVKVPGVLTAVIPFLRPVAMLFVHVPSADEDTAILVGQAAEALTISRLKPAGVDIAVIIHHDSLAVLRPVLPVALVA